MGIAGGTLHAVAARMRHGCLEGWGRLLVHDQDLVVEGGPVRRANLHSGDDDGPLPHDNIEHEAVAAIVHALVLCSHPPRAQGKGHERKVMSISKIHGTG